MGLFKGAKNTYKKSEAAVIVQNLLSEAQELADLQKEPRELANTLVEGAWKQKPDVFEGKFGQRPHKLTTACISLAVGLQTASRPTSYIDTGTSGAMAFALGRALSEVQTNGQYYPFNSIDWEFINTSVQVFEEIQRTETS